MTIWRVRWSFAEKKSIPGFRVQKCEKLFTTEVAAAAFVEKLTEAFHVIGSNGATRIETRSVEVSQ